MSGWYPPSGYIAPDDERFHYQANPASVGSPYPTTLDFDDGPPSSAPYHGHPQPNHYGNHLPMAFSPPISYAPGYPSDGGYNSSTVPSSQTSGGRIFSPGASTRGFTDHTDPADDLNDSGNWHGKRCLFHWIKCPKRFNEFDDWAMHCEEHLPPPDAPGIPRHHRRDFMGTPVWWGCGYNHCGYSIKEDDHQLMWESKLRHIFEHLLQNHILEYNAEREDWLKYYYKLGLCHKDDVPGYRYRPTDQPYNQPAMQWKSAKTKTTSVLRLFGGSKGKSESGTSRDALGERSVPGPDQNYPGVYNHQATPGTGYNPSYPPGPQPPYSPEYSPGGYQAPYAPNPQDRTHWGSG